jgi:opacity protein-like surface antigen
MRIYSLGLAAALVLAPLAASAQTAAENFSYKAPSGMFGEGTAKWQMYRFMHEDRERTEALNAGRDLSTGSVQGTAIGSEQYARPGESGSRRLNRR